MVVDAERCEVLEQVAAVADLPGHLPSFITERRAIEGSTRGEQVLKLLSCEPVPPSITELGYALRSLKILGDQMYSMDVKLRVDISVAVWRLFSLCTPGKPRAYNYFFCERLAETLVFWLQEVSSRHIDPPWMERPEKADAKAEVERLSQILDVRIPMDMMIQEMNTGFCSDEGVGRQKQFELAGKLMKLCVVLRKFTPVDVRRSIVYSLSHRLDAQYCHMMVFAKLLTVFAPKEEIPELLRSGKLWEWWSGPPEGLVPKFDLMWFAILARYAKMQWVGQAAVDAEAEKALMKQLPWLLNKAWRILSLPLCSPAASQIEGFTDHTPTPDRNPIPSEIDHAIMGVHQTTWRKVVKFIVYRLPADPPKAAKVTCDTNEYDLSNNWGWLELFLHRMHCFMKPSKTSGEWFFHCVLFIQHAVQIYFKRVCRERLLPCKVPEKHRLTKAADERFVGMLMPVLNDCMQNVQAIGVCYDILSRLSRLAAMNAESGNLEPPANPFTVDMTSMLCKAVEALNDPSQSHKHSPLLGVFASTMPSLLLRYPAVVGELLPVTLMGIDSTDLWKTLSTFNVLIFLFSHIPCVDANDWPGAEGSTGEPSTKVETRWPAPAGSNQDMEPGGQYISSVFPGFALDLFDRISQFIAGIPKLSGHGVQTLESMACDVMQTAVYLIASHCDTVAYKNLVEALQSWLCTNLLPDHVKPMKVLVSAIVRADVNVALPIVLPSLFKKLLMKKKDAKTYSSLQDSNVSETEAKWMIGGVTAAVRHGGPTLLKYKTELEELIRITLMDDREGIPKLGATLFKRILFSTTGTYVKGDYRICSAQRWQKLMTNRLCMDVQSENSWPVQWWGYNAPWWASETPSIDWHIPSDEEVKWAQSLVHGALNQVDKLLSPLTNKTDLNTSSGPDGSGWLDGLQMPEKKKVAHKVMSGLRLARVVSRGTSDLWPDERTDAELEKKLLPKISPHSNENGRVIFERVSSNLLATLSALSKQDLVQKDAALPAGLDDIEVPKLLEKTIKCLGELLNAPLQPHQDWSRLLPSTRGIQGVIWIDESPLGHIHKGSAWRDLPRVLWVNAVSDHMRLRVSKCSGEHVFEGRRKELLELLCHLSVSGTFEKVRGKAQVVLLHAARHHVGSKWKLVHGIVLPKLEAETKKVMDCGSVAADEAAKEELRLNNALDGVCCTIHQLTEGIWRRCVQDTAAVGKALCEVIYAATRSSSDTTKVSKSAEQRCEVKVDTIATLIGTMKNWLRQREVQTWQPVRSKSAIDVHIEEITQNSGKAGYEALQGMINICRRSDCHWRAQVVVTAGTLALWSSLQSFAPDAENEPFVKGVLISLVKWLVSCCESKGTPALHQLGVHGLMLLLNKRGVLSVSDFKACGLLETGFLEKLLTAVPHLHHASLGEGEQGDRLDPIYEAVTLMTERHHFVLWPSVWLKRSSRSFSLWNTLFWQSLVELYLESSPEQLEAMLAHGGKFLSEKDVSETEYHVAVSEFAAGALRALHVEKHSQHLTTAWRALYPWLSSELRKASQERLEEYCDAVRYVIAGTSQPLLEGPLFSAPASTAGAQNNAFMIPLLNFVINPDETPQVGTLSSTLIPISYDREIDGGAGKENSDFNPPPRKTDSSTSSFETYKRLRLLMAVLLEPASIAHIGNDKTFCTKLFESLRTGLGHPYKQLREETARSLFFVLRAESCCEGSTGLGHVAPLLTKWLGDEAQRLLPKLREEKSATSDDRPLHVVESSGLCYTLVHTALARLTSHLLGQTVPKCLGFLLAASVHSDFELRALATQALSLCCSAGLASPVIMAKQPKASTDLFDVMSDILRADSTKLPYKEREKALQMGARQLLLANFFIMNCKHESLSNDNITKFMTLRALVEAAMSDGKVEVRHAARSALCGILAMDSDEMVKSHLKKFKAKAGPVPKRGEAAPAESSGMIGGVMGLSAALLVSMDAGVAPWVGSSIETIAPYGRAGIPEEVRKEVQKTVQAFLKLHQSSQQSWRECKEMLSRTQFELLEEYKGGHSYFS